MSMITEEDGLLAKPSQPEGYGRRGPFVLAAAVFMLGALVGASTMKTFSGHRGPPLAMSSDDTPCCIKCKDSNGVKFTWPSPCGDCSKEYCPDLQYLRDVTP